MKLIFDIEADGLLDKVTKIHCIVTKDITTGKVEQYFGETIAIGVKTLEMADVLYAHNGIGYDYPLLKKLYNWQPKGVLHDTYILSQLLYPNEMQSHGIEAWGKVLGRAKPKHEDWSTFSMEMLHRCTEDVEILNLVAGKMLKRMENHDWSKAIELEYETYRTYCRHNTFAYINVKRLQTLIKRLEQCMTICDRLILKQAPLIVEYEEDKTVKPFTKSGAMSVNCTKYCFETDINPSIIKGEFCKVEFKAMNINSTQQLIKFLLDKGWKPDTFNYKTDDKGKFVRDPHGELIVTSPSLQESAFIGVPAQLKKLLVKRGTFKHRYGVLVGWMNKQVDGKLETFAYTSGTNCVTADTLIQTDTGLIPILDVCKGDRVISHNGTYDKVTDFIVSGVQDIYQVVLQSGNVVKGTRNHPLLTKDGIFVNLENIKPGDEVFILDGAEEWKSHPDFDRYLFSSWGRILIKSTGLYMDYTVSTAKLRRLPLHDRRSVDLIKSDGTKVRRSRGAVILEAFVGSRPGGTECCHLDGNPTNNHLNNLCWGTSKENSAHTLAHGRLQLSSSVRRLLSDTQLAEIRSTPYYKGFDTDFANRFKVSRKLINNIRNGKRYKTFTKHIRNKYVQSFKLTRVVSIIPLGRQPVYDITVEDSHSFVGNGVVQENTSRWKHRGLVNVPRVGTYFGKEMRGLFVPPPGMVIVGCDSAQLEARIEGHFCYAYDQGEYAKFLLEADIHQASADAWGISRQDAKSPNYALAYQCSWKKIQELLECSEDKAKDIHRIYWEMRPAASKLIKDLEKSLESRVGVEPLPGGRVKRPELVDARSWIKGIDGRKLFVRSWHSLKNTLIQNAGMLCMKHSYNWMSDQLKKQNIKARIWLCYHDEIQVYCKPEDAEQVRLLALQAIEEGGKHFKLNIPLKGDAKISTSWAGSH